MNTSERIQVVYDLIQKLSKGDGLYENILQLKDLEYEYNSLLELEQNEQQEKYDY